MGLLLLSGATTAGRDMGCSGWGFMQQLVFCTRRRSSLPCTTTPWTRVAYCLVIQSVTAFTERRRTCPR
jgi:hypothetical protein